jgi:hypothetical protein
MRKVLLTLAVAATVGLAGARADVSYRYEAEFAQYNTGSVVAPGGQINTVNIYLVETVTAGGATSTSRIFTDGGLFGAGVKVTRTSGDGTIRLSTTSPFPAFSANGNQSGNTTVGFAGNGFGGLDNSQDPPAVIAPTINDRTPSTTTQAGLIVNADRGPNAVAVNQLGPQVPAPGGPGVYKLRLGSLNFIVGNQNTTWQVTNYGPAKSTVDQATVDLDFPTAPNNNFTGAANPLGGFFSFTIVGAAIPEPSSMALCGLIASGMGYAGFRRRKTATVVA